jgi:hypothetical protein
MMPIFSLRDFSSANRVSFGRPVMNVSFEQNHVVRVFLSEKGRRMAVAIARQDVMDLKEVVGWNAENLD